MMTNSSESWSLCDNTPSLQGHPIFSLRSETEFRSEIEYDQQVMERNQRLAYQGLLDNCNDVGITEAKLQEAQAPLKKGTRQPGMEDWKRMRKYLGNVPADMVCNTFNHTTQIGTLPPSSHLKTTIQVSKPCSQHPLTK